MNTAYKSGIKDIQNRRIGALLTFLNMVYINNEYAGDLSREQLAERFRKLAATPFDRLLYAQE